MKKLAFTLLASFILISCSNSERDHRDQAAADTTSPQLDTTNKAQTYTADVNLNGDEKVFLLNSSISVHRIVELTHLASQKANDRNLRGQAKLLETGNRKMLDDLKAIANGKGIQLTNDEPKEIKILNEMPKNLFDKEYIKLILLEHANLIQELEKGSKLTNTNMKNFAVNSLPTVNKNNSDLAKILVN